MTKLRGLFTDCQEHKQPEGMYRHALNIADSTILGSKENEDGFLEIGELAPYLPVGIAPIGEDFIIFSTDDTDSEIGLATKAGTTYTYNQIYNDPDLEFDSSKRIKAETRVDINGDRIVTWVQEGKPPRILNIDDVGSISDINDLLLFQDVTNPEYGFSISNTGGSVLTGAYIPITRYKNVDGSQTNWSVQDQVIYINEEPTSATFDQMDGSVGGVQTNKLINLSFTNLDTRFDTLVLGYIKISNGVVTAVQTREVTNASSVNTSITGAETVTDLSLDEILTPTINYDTAKTITQLAGRLYLGNLTAATFPELQPSALNIKINYTSTLVDVTQNTTGHKSTLPPTFIPGEVYAFYLGVELNKGGWVYYHIPGRPGLPDGELALTSGIGLSYYYYQVGDTTDKTGSGATTNMGYWENLNEQYPNDPAYDASALGGEDLRGAAVRHHRMPTLEHLMTTYYSGDATVGITRLPRLQVEATNVVIPAEIQPLIKRWKIFYAKKSPTDSLFSGCDLLQFGVPRATDSTVRWGTGGNWGVQAEPSGADTWEDFSAPQVDTLRGHCLDHLYDSANASVTYAWFNYQLSRVQVNSTYTGFRSSGAKMAVTGSGRGSNSAAVIDFTTTNTTRSGSPFAKSLTNYHYLEPNAVDGKFKNTYTEGTFVADINTPSTSFSGMTLGTLLTNSGGQAPDADPWTGFGGSNGGEDTMFITYFRLLDNVHVSFTSQEVIPLTGDELPSSTTSGLISGGDGFLCYLSYLACGPNNANPDDNQTDPYSEGTRVWKAYIGYSRYNFNFRHETAGDLSTLYHGKTDVRSLFSPYANNPATFHTILITLSDGVNNIQYNTDYNRMNNFMGGVIWHPDLVQETEFPNDVIWSPVQSEDSKELSWRTFLANDRYVMPKNKGEIINLQGIGVDTLLIHHKHTLYTTRTDLEIATDADAAYLTSGNLFAVPPREVIPVQGGYAGTQNQLACKLTKVGYAFPDGLQGKFYLYQGDKLEEISSNGMRSFFRDFMGALDSNPKEYEVGYDEKYNRLIVSRRGNDTSWTISYNPQGQYWVSYHSYAPYFMFNTIDNVLISVYVDPEDDTATYFNHSIVNDSNVKGVYYTDTVYPSFIDAVFNQEPKRDKLFKSVNWVTEVYPTDRTAVGQIDTTLDYNTTCTHLTLRTPTHCTGRTALVRNSYFDSIYNSNIRNVNRTWYYNEIRDIATNSGFTRGFYNNFDIDTSLLNTSMEWYDKRRFIDKYVICRFEYDNTQDKRCILVDSDIEYEYVAK